MLKEIEELYQKYSDDFSWSDLEKEQAKAFERQLTAEVITEHELYHLLNKLIAVAKNERNDDVMFTDGTRFYNVHLTWNKGTVIYPKYSIIENEELISFFEDDYLKG